MWYPAQESALKMAAGHCDSKNNLDSFVCSLDLERIRRAFADLFENKAQLPDNIKPYGEVLSEDDWYIMYCLSTDSFGERPLLSLAADKPGECSFYKCIHYDGVVEDSDFGDNEDEMIRISGIGQNCEYHICAYYEPDGYHFFWENSSPFSQWHKCSFSALGLTFNSAEQYMMFQKALLFDDKETAEKILNTRDVRKQKELGRQVKGFDDEIWKTNCLRIVYEANKYKFTQNEDLLLKLLSTQGQLLVEASPYDTIWGIGLSADDPRAQDKAQWLGTNWLGYVLTQLRDDIIYCIENCPDWEKEERDDIPLNDVEYETFIRGYQPDWDCRYAPRYINGWHYITRSGFWVKKFRYEKQSDGLYHLTDHYTSQIEKGIDILRMILAEGYFEPRLHHLLNYHTTEDEPMSKEPSTMAKRRILYKECQIAGTTFHDLGDIWDELEIGTRLALVRDKDNKHDNKAVAVALADDYEGDPEDFDFDFILGYVPRTENSHIAAMLDLGWADAFECEISQIIGSNPYKGKLMMNIYMVSKEECIVPPFTRLLRVLSLDAEEFRSFTFNLEEMGFTYFRWGGFPPWEFSLLEEDDKVVFLHKRENDSILYLMQCIAKGDDNAAYFVKDKDSLHAVDDCCYYVLTNVKGPIVINNEDLRFIAPGEICTSQPDRPLSEEASERLLDLFDLTMEPESPMADELTTEMHSEFMGEEMAGVIEELERINNKNIQ